MRGKDRGERVLVSYHPSLGERLITLNGKMTNLCFEPTEQARIFSPFGQAVYPIVLRNLLTHYSADWEAGLYGVANTSRLPSLLITEQSLRVIFDSGPFYIIPCGMHIALFRN